jgi:hypothetical protein
MVTLYVAMEVVMVMKHMKHAQKTVTLLVSVTLVTFLIVQAMVTAV